MKVNSNISGDVGSKTGTWPISGTEYWKWAKSAKFSFSRVYIFKSKLNRTKLHHILIKKWLKLYIETLNVNFKLKIRCEN